MCVGDSFAIDSTLFNNSSYGVHMLCVRISVNREGEGWGLLHRKGAVTRKNPQSTH